jgi:hypothetical protein
MCLSAAHAIRCGYLRRTQPKNRTKDSNQYAATHFNESIFMAFS